MNIFIEEPRLNVDRPGQSAWLTPGATEYLEAVRQDLETLDPEFQCKDSQRLVQCIWHIMDSVTVKEVGKVPLLYIKVKLTSGLLL